jgi:hypothetical protein
MRYRLPKTEIHDGAPFNTWFAEKYPKAVERFGPGFLEGRYEDQHADTRFVPAALNEDAWAAALSEKVPMVYFPPEAQFYFLDPRAVDGGAYCPTSVEKVALLVSNQLMRCAQACPLLVDIENLVVKFRKPDALKGIVDKAKVILACADGFFTGTKGMRRAVNGKVIEANAEPTYVQFVKKTVVRQAEAKLTIQDAFSRYYQFCKQAGEPPLTRADFKQLVGEAIREVFKIGLRHDVKDVDGVERHGWVGIDCSFGRN